jgi:uncharacterized protein HemX
MTYPDPSQHDLPFREIPTRREPRRDGGEMMEGDSSAGRVAMALMGVAFLVAVVLYGLNTQRAPSENTSDAAATQTASGPAQAPQNQQDASTKSGAASQTTGQGGGENAAPGQAPNQGAGRQPKPDNQAKPKTPQQ